MTSEILIPGWQFYGLSQEHYAASIDKEVFYKGTQSACLEAVSETAPGSAGIHQIIDATNYRNKRIRFTAFIKTRDVEDRCGLYLCATNGVCPTASNDMSMQSPLRGTNDWQQFSLVLNVLTDHQLNFGVILSGAGAVWIDAAALEIVGDEVDSTDISRSKFANSELGGDNGGSNEDLQTLPKSPMNMDFEST